MQQHQQSTQNQKYPSWAQPQKQLNKTSTAAVAAGEGMSGTTKLIVAFILGLVIGWLLTWSWFDLRSPKGSAVTAATSTAQTANPTKAAGSKTASNSKSVSTVAVAPSGTVTKGTTGIVTNNTIAVPSPQEAGMTVAVSNLSAKTPVWVVVYEDNGGVRGRALGAHLVPAGQTSTTISLLRSTLPNLNYYVGLVADTSAHSFSTANQPILGANGKQVMASFMAQ